MQRISSCPYFWIISIYKEFLVLKSCVQAHLPLCSQFYFLSEQYILYMRGWINSGVDQTAFVLVSSAVSVPFSHTVTQQINKEFLDNLSNISRLSKKSWGCQKTILLKLSISCIFYQCFQFIAPTKFTVLNIYEY